MIVEIPMILAFFIDKTVGYRIILAGFILESLIFIKWLSLRDLIKRTERVVTESEIVYINIYIYLCNYLYTK